MVITLWPTGVIISQSIDIYWHLFNI